MHSLIHNKHFIFVLYKYNANIIYSLLLLLFLYHYYLTEQVKDI